MSASPQASPLKEWLDTGEILFGSDLNDNFTEVWSSYNDHTHTEYPDQTGVETISGVWTFSAAPVFSATPLFSHATPARFTGAGWVDGDIIYLSGGNGSLTRLAKGTARQTLEINTGATAPAWTSTPLFASLAVVPGGAIEVNGEGGDAFIKEPASGAIGFYTADTERLRIHADGDIGIGVDKWLYLDGPAGGSDVRIRGTDDGGTDAFQVWISDIATLQVDRIVSPGDTSLTVNCNVDSVPLSMRLKFGADATGPGGVGRAVYITG